MWAFDLEVPCKGIKALEGPEISHFVLLADEGKGDVEGRVDIRGSAYIEKWQLEAVGFIYSIDDHDLRVLLPHLLTLRESPENSRDMPLMLPIEVLDAALLEGSN